MDVLALFLTVIGLASWLGSTVFMMFVVVPVAQRRLGATQSREILDVMGPRHSFLAVISAVLMLSGGTGALFHEQLRTPTITFMVLTGVALAIVLYASLVIFPRTASLRDRLQGSAGSEMNFEIRERYDQALRLAMFYNVLNLVILTGAAAALASLLVHSPAPPPAGG
jgi:uncharacterized membrane protein